MACSTPSARDQVEKLESLPVPEAWHNESVSGTLTEHWLAELGHGELVALVDEALDNSPLMQAMDANLDAAEATARMAAGAKLPSLGLGAGASRQKAQVATVGAQTSTRYNAGLNASWELDVWGIVGDETQAALAQFEAAGYDYEAFKLTLVANVCRAYFVCLEARQQMELARESHQSFENNLKTLERRYERGLVDSLDVRLARSQLASSRAALQQRRNQWGESVRQLETLLGRTPAGVWDSGEVLSASVKSIPVGMPSELLERRPDLLASERRLAALDSALRAASKNRFPRISLTASGGTASSELEDLVDMDFGIWSLAANISAPLFQGGRLGAQQDLARAQYEEAVARYFDTVLNAFREVENGLASARDLEVLKEQLAIAAAESSAAETQAWSLYEKGLVDITSVLSAQQRKVSTHSEYISILNQTLQNRIQIFTSLGGAY